MPVGYVSDEYYAALADVLLEFSRPGSAPVVTRSTASGGVHADLAPGTYEVCLNKTGYGSKRVQIEAGTSPVHFRLLSDRLLGYAWPKWCRAGEPVQFRVHTLEPYKLGLWRQRLPKEVVRHIGLEVKP